MSFPRSGASGLSRAFHPLKDEMLWRQVQATNEGRDEVGEAAAY
jgi:hypothetical protein